MERDPMWFNALKIAIHEIRNSELNQTMDWNDVFSFQEHLDKLTFFQELPGQSKSSLKFLTHPFMNEPEYMEFLHEHLKVKVLKEKLENDLESKNSTLAQGGQVFTKSGKAKI
ncbi:hypothetical protein [Burkholderia contaminans]|uniref:hypothetical protein n=1 Tax=Burkholderia contaminans TaxID=488447 RepID=UPI00158D96BF|nr:hypothetical protein [Burkholderia contaminans]